jgi:hypothetical protein
MTVLSTKGSAEAISGMDMVYKYGQMVLNMRDTGEIMLPTEEANSTTLTVMSMMVT